MSMYVFIPIEVYDWDIFYKFVFFGTFTSYICMHMFMCMRGAGGLNIAEI